MKVILISFWFTDYTIELANALAKTIKVDILLSDKFITEPYLDLLDRRVGVKIFRLRRFRYPHSVFMVYKLYREIAKLKPDLIHIQGDDQLWFSLLLPLLKKKYPLITTIHEIRPLWGENTWKSPLFVRNIYRNLSSRLIVHSELFKNKFAQLDGISPQKISVVPHHCYPLYEKLINPGIEESENVILFFGTIRKQKGLRYLIEAEPLISRVIPGVKIIIAGSVRGVKLDRNIFKRKDKFIIYNGHIPHVLAAELFQTAGVVVLPYVDAYQSGVVALAYSFKKPVIATRVGYIPEQVENHKTGLLIKPGDPAELADAIIGLLKDKEKRKEMGNNAYTKANTELSPDRIAEKTIEVYLKALNGG